MQQLDLETQQASPSPPLMMIARGRAGAGEAEQLRAELQRLSGRPWALRAPDSVSAVMDYADVVVALFTPDQEAVHDLRHDVDRYAEKTQGLLIPVMLGGHWDKSVAPPAHQHLAWTTTETTDSIARAVVSIVRSSRPALLPPPPTADTPQQASASGTVSIEPAATTAPDPAHRAEPEPQAASRKKAPAKAAPRTKTRKAAARAVPPLEQLTAKYALSASVHTLLEQADHYARSANPPADLSTGFVFIAIGDLGKTDQAKIHTAGWLRSWLGERFEGLRSAYLKRRRVPAQGEPAEGSGPQPSEGVAQALERAREYARRTTGVEQIHTRHLLAALLNDTRPPQRSSVAAILVEAGLHAAEMRTALLQQLAGFEDNQAAWSQILRGPSPVVRRLGEFHADSLHGEDLIGIGQEVTALATLIAARTLKPPLSVGLFGDWGSGKSFFMRQIRHTVTQLSEEARGATDDAGQPLMQRDLPFYKRIVQIEFNAWHYVEGNLWASLMEHIFRNLELKGTPMAEDVLKRGLLKELDQAVQTRDEAEGALTQAHQALVTANQELQDAAEEYARRSEEAEQLRLADLTGEISLPEVRDALNPQLERLGLKPTSDRAHELGAALQRAYDTTQRGWAVLIPLFKGPGRWVRVAVVIGILCGLPAAALYAVSWLAGTAEMRLVWARLAELSGFLVAATGVMIKGTDWVSARVGELEAIRARYDRRIQEEKRALIAAQERAAEAQRVFDEKQQQSEQARLALEKARAALDAATVDRLLDQFVEDRAASTDYRQHLGMLAIVRRDFETLSELIEKQNWQLNPADGVSDRAYGSAVRRFATLEEELREEQTRINRIVLYIDDLDRCPPAKVVEVLQAVHLLLAFPLFVAVVGVDARWITRSLESHYRNLLHTGQTTVDPMADLPRPAIARDYLEKIFQVPFWLRPMEGDACNRLLDALMGKAVPPPPPDPALPRPEDKKEEAPEPASIDHGAEGHAAPPPPPPGKKPEPPPPPPARPVSNPDALLINDAERSFIGVVSPLLDRSPRSLKRFVNVYRLIKAGLPASEAEVFVSEKSGSGYRMALLLLAVDTGLPDLAPALFRGVAELAGAEVSGTLALREALERDRDVSGHADWPRLSAWMAEHAAELDVRFDVRAFAEWVPRVQRYSFQAAQLEPPAAAPEAVARA